MVIPTLKLQIRLYGDPCLRKKSSPIKDVGPSERLLIRSMIVTMQEAKGVGLAAPQVGLNQRIFVADIGEGPMAFINPRIIKKVGSDVMEEGCLSIPGVTVEVKRAKKVWIRYTDEENREKERVFEDLLARVIQHEHDHIEGKMIVDYAKRSERKDIEKKLKAVQGNKT